MLLSGCEKQTSFIFLHSLHLTIFCFRRLYLSLKCFEVDLLQGHSLKTSQKLIGASLHDLTGGKVALFGRSHCLHRLLKEISETLFNQCRAIDLPVKLLELVCKAAEEVVNIVSCFVANEINIRCTSGATMRRCGFHRCGKSFFSLHLFWQISFYWSTFCRCSFSFTMDTALDISIGSSAYVAVPVHNRDLTNNSTSFTMTSRFAVSSITAWGRFQKTFS